jgi:hypothetical protein
MKGLDLWGLLFHFTHTFLCKVLTASGNFVEHQSLIQFEVLNTISTILLSHLLFSLICYLQESLCRLTHLRLCERVHEKYVMIS